MNAHYASGRQHTHNDTNASINLKGINLKEITPDLFDKVAEATAKNIATSKVNKSTQLRRFYDEICFWHERVEQDETKFQEYLPYIRMLNAKVAYAKGRKHVDDNFVQLLGHCLKQVESPTTMKHFKFFMEAFMGFFKATGQ